MTFKELQSKLSIDLVESEWRQAKGGGWIQNSAKVECEDNIKGDSIIMDKARIFGNARVYGKAWVSGNALVYGNAQVTGDAWVSGDAQVLGNAFVAGNALVSGYAQVSDALVTEDAQVAGNAQVSGDARVYGNAQVTGDARVYGDAHVSGDAMVYGDAHVSGDAMVYGNAQVSGDASIKGSPIVTGPVGFTPPFEISDGRDQTSTAKEEIKPTPKIDRESVKVLQECIELQLRKSNDYQNGHSVIKQADYYPHGVITLLDIIHAKKLRMDSVIAAMNSDPAYKPNFESIADSAMDMCNYCSFIVAYCRGKMDGQLADRDFLNRPIVAEPSLGTR